jgi:hypothetical protein
VTDASTPSDWHFDADAASGGVHPIIQAGRRGSCSYHPHTVAQRRLNTASGIMDREQRWAHLVALDDELLRAGVILSEWCSFIVREADIAFAEGANLASILTAVSGIETYLRSEHSESGKERLVELITHASIDDALKADLHALRKYRNKWVHVDDPWNDASLLDRPEETEDELERMALFAARALRRTIYENQWV